MMTRTSVTSAFRYRAMPPATPANILSSPDRRSGRASGWPLTAADPATAVFVFMLQGCRPAVVSVDGDQPGLHPSVLPEGIGVIPYEVRGIRRTARAAPVRLRLSRRATIRLHTSGALTGATPRRPFLRCYRAATGWGLGGLPAGPRLRSWPRNKRSPASTEGHSVNREHHRPGPGQVQVAPAAGITTSPGAGISLAISTR